MTLKFYDVVFILLLIATLTVLFIAGYLNLSLTLGFVLLGTGYLPSLLLFIPYKKRKRLKKYSMEASFVAIIIIYLYKIFFY